MPSNLDDETTIIFWIDISGSMDESKNVKGLPNLKYIKNKNYPTRLECVKVAIDSQI